MSYLILAQVFYIHGLTPLFPQFCLRMHPSYRLAIPSARRSLRPGNEGLINETNSFPQKSKYIPLVGLFLRRYILPCKGRIYQSISRYSPATTSASQSLSIIRHNVISYS